MRLNPEPEAATKRRRVLAVLGTFGMIGAPMLLIEFLLRLTGYIPEGQPHRAVGVLETLYIGGWLCSATGLRILRVMGRGAGSAALSVIQFALLALALGFALHEVAETRAEGSVLLGIADVAWPASHAYMLVVFAAIRSTGEWRGWRAMSPLVCGMALPVLFAATALVGNDLGGTLFGVFTAGGFMLLGAAVRSSP